MIRTTINLANSPKNTWHFDEARPLCRLSAPIPSQSRIAKDGLQQIHNGLWILWGDVVLTSWAVASGIQWPSSAWKKPWGKPWAPLLQRSPVTGGKSGSCCWSWTAGWWNWEIFGVFEPDLVDAKKWHAKKNCSSLLSHPLRPHAGHFGSQPSPAPGHHQLPPSISTSVSAWAWRNHHYWCSLQSLAPSNRTTPRAARSLARDGTVISVSMALSGTASCWRRAQQWKLLFYLFNLPWNSETVKTCRNASSIRAHPHNAWKTRVLLNRAACPGVVVCQLLCIRWQPSRPILHWILPLLVLAAGPGLVDLPPKNFQTLQGLAA